MVPFDAVTTRGAAAPLATGVTIAATSPASTATMSTPKPVFFLDSFMFPPGSGPPVIGGIALTSCLCERSAAGHHVHRGQRDDPSVVPGLERVEVGAVGVHDAAHEGEVGIGRHRDVAP